MAFRPFATLDVEHVMDAIEHAIAPPPDEVVIYRTARRKILRNITPLTTGAQDVHQTVDPARMSVRRLPPPGRGAGMSGAITAHSSSVTSLGYRR